MKMRYNVPVYGKHIRLNFIMARRKAAGERPRGAVVVPRFNERGSANEESYHIIAHCCHGPVAGGRGERNKHVKAVCVLEDQESGKRRYRHLYFYP